MSRNQNQTDTDKLNLFLICAECDRQTVSRYADVLRESGCALHFDYGSGPQTDNYEIVANRLKNSDAVIVFLTNAALQARNVRREVNYTINEDIPLLCVYLEECIMTYGMQFQLGVCPSVYLWKNDDMESLLETLLATVSGKLIT